MEVEFKTMHPDVGTSFLKEFPNIIAVAKSQNLLKRVDEFEAGETNGESI